MIFKTILSLRTLNGIPFLLTGISPTFKVISRTSSEQNINVVGKWDLLSAVCLERHPIIIKPMLNIEVRYQKMLQQIEFEGSMISDFDIQKQKKRRQKSETFASQNMVSNQTIQDLEDSWEEELTKFKFASKINEIEEDNAVVSLKRKLDKNLILLVEQKIGDSNLWIPPQSVRKHRETMIQTAHRTLQELCGNNIKVKFYGNAPIGFYQYKYPISMQEKGQNGAKIFYFLAKYISGDISSSVNHCWLDRKELRKVIHPAIHKSLSKFLLPD
ncbi:39S ribosomal protein L46, mitochondrial [Eufriesea mexicana]|uniref:Large ribosomal subunit protein mL46 n=1 Tax=Eufriesea mexicana TaxID=516756 RepID=A0A310SL05_9HYME|nr:PREDICTED: 39S ribosomal protein L46, mitochondrial [Eufriesea mexicana]OAD57059.1 39S ribosomal protein L46, mitochondrial [Eufriesea mexicana]